MPSSTRRRWIDVACLLFAGANLAAIVLFPKWQTLPFHYIWVTLSVVYCYRAWRLRTAMTVLLAACLATGTATVWAAVRIGEDMIEVAEVPLMGAMFLAMALHAMRREAAAERASRLAASTQEFVENASHELRTPITVARGHAQLLRAAAVGRQAAADVEVVLEELERLSRISDRLLILAAAEQPSFLALEPLDLQALVGRSVDRWRIAATSRRWHVDLAVEGTLPADEERLGSAIDALLENAVKYTSEGALIGVSARAEGELVAIDVSDSGVGIAPEELPRIFDRFYRGNGNGKGNGKGNGAGTNGTGLGLAIVKTIVEAHGGSVCVTSEVGRGTRFSIRLAGFSPSR